MIEYVVVYALWVCGGLIDVSGNDSECYLGYVKKILHDGCAIVQC